MPSFEFQVQASPKPTDTNFLLRRFIVATVVQKFVGIFVRDDGRLWTLLPSSSAGADKLVGLYSAHAVPYAMPWVADEMGMFKKYDLDFEFVYIPSSSTATAALLGGNVEVGLLGGIGVVNAFVNGATDLVLIGSIKNFMTQSILAKPEITKLQELKGKKIGVTRIGSNTHYFSVQAFRRAGMNPEKDVLFLFKPGETPKLWARCLPAG